MAARYLLFGIVGVWGDAGFYLYDAHLIHQGLAPYIDFIGRSPLFNYLYAYSAVVLGNDITTLRLFIAIWWLLAGVPVYLIARGVHGHTAGIASLVVFHLSPFILSYGYWGNTQSLAAFLGVTAVALLVYYRTWWAFAGAGSLLGLAFLSRRSSIAVLAGVGLWICWRAYRRRSPVKLFSRSVWTLSGFFVMLAVGYYIFAGFDVSTALAYARLHGWGLIQSSGRGGFPIIGAEGPEIIIQNSLRDGRIPIFNDVCQLCGQWTARTFAKTLLVTIPVVGPLFYYWRDWADRWFTGEIRTYTFGVLGLLGAYAIYLAVQAGYYVRAGGVFSLGAFAVVAFSTKPVDRDVLYDEDISLLLLVLFGLTVGYLYRNKLIHTYYFADFLPYLAVVSGILYIECWRRVADE